MEVTFHSDFVHTCLKSLSIVGDRAFLLADSHIYDSLPVYTCLFTVHSTVSTDFPKKRLKPFCSASASHPDFCSIYSCDFVLGLGVFGLDALFVN